MSVFIRLSLSLHNTASEEDRSKTLGFTDETTTGSGGAYDLLSYICRMMLSPREGAAGQPWGSDY